MHVSCNCEGPRQPGAKVCDAHLKWDREFHEGFWLRYVGAAMTPQVKLGHALRTPTSFPEDEELPAPDRLVRVAGTHYVVGDEPQPGERRGWGLGFGGSKFTIEFFDGRRVVSHNVWCQGDIPAEYREQMPDNARFVEG